MIQDSICAEFCNGLRVREVRNGYAISLPYKNFMGEELSFYALRETEDQFRIFDDGTTIPHLEAAGATLDNSTRSAAFGEILKEHQARYDENRGEIYRYVESEESLPRAVLDFAAALLRVSDLLFMIQERAESTFREDVRKQVFAALEKRAVISENEPVSDELSEITPDMVLRAEARDPVAFFIATSPIKLHEAIELHLMATHEYGVPLKVIAMIESDAVSFGRVRVRADNRLHGVLRFRDEEKAAIERLQREVLGWKAISRPQPH